MEKKVNLEIQCPHCEEQNDIALPEDIKCNECKKTLIGFKYENVILSSTATLVIGGILGTQLDDTININRASVKTEYKMMKTCINEFGYSKSVRDNCYCAVESMSGFLDAQKARLYHRDTLKKLLEDRYNSCKN